MKFPPPLQKKHDLFKAAFFLFFNSILQVLIWFHSWGFEKKESFVLDLLQKKNISGRHGNSLLYPEKNFEIDSANMMEKNPKSSHFEKRRAGLGPFVKFRPDKNIFCLRAGLVR